MASNLCSSLEASSKSKTYIFKTSSSFESSRTSSNPLSRDKSASGPWVAKVGMEDGVTTNDYPSLTACERVAKGSLVEITGERVTGEALSA